MSEDKDGTGCSTTSIIVTEEDKILFEDVQDTISENVRRMMETLWVNWSHLGIDHKTKRDRIMNLVHIERDLHRDVIAETEQKLKKLNNDTERLKQEAIELGKCLSTNIQLPDFSADDKLMIDYKNELEDRIAGFRSEVERRKVDITRMTEWQRDLCEVLGTTPKEIREVPLLSNSEIESFQRDLQIMQNLKDDRDKKFYTTRIEIKDIMNSLGLKPMTRFETKLFETSPPDFKLTERNMELVEELLLSFQERQQETMNRVAELREKLNRLWGILEVDSLHRSNFLKAHPGYGPSTEKAIREELAQCEKIKKEHIKRLVSKIRNKIERMWDQCMFSKEQRLEFLHYYQDIYSEDTLTLHELYLGDLHKLYDENKKLFELVNVRRELWEEMLDLEAKASEPNRYQNRGGKLLQEERQRKANAIKLPKIEVQLEEKLKEYITKYGKPFTVNGVPLDQIIQNDWDTLNSERHNKISARKQALTPNTPSYRSLAVSPLGKRNRTVAGLAMTAERTRPVKRPLVTASASKLAVAPSESRSALKRSAITTVKKRMSGRIAALVAAAAAEAEMQSKPRRKLNYNELNPPRIVVNGSILKHKRRSKNRRSSSRRSLNVSKMNVTSSVSQEGADALNQVADSTMLTSYTDFKEHINENQSTRSSLVQGKMDTKLAISRQPTLYEITPKKKNITTQVFTPKHGKENIMSEEQNLRTPKETRSSVKSGVFLTPRAPLSAAKTNLIKQNTPAATKTPNSAARSNLVRQNTQIPTPNSAQSGISRSKSTHTLRPRNFLL